MFWKQILKEFPPEDDFTEVFIEDLFSLANLEEAYIETKHWGFKYNLFSSPFISTDICWVHKGGYCSKHSHEYKQNRFFVLMGQLQIDLIHPSGKESDIRLGSQSKSRKFDIFPGYVHRFEALEPTIFVELEYGKCIKEDIARQDTGGRR